MLAPPVATAHGVAVVVSWARREGSRARFGALSFVAVCAMALLTLAQHRYDYQVLAWMIPLTIIA